MINQKSDKKVIMFLLKVSVFYKLKMLFGNETIKAKCAAYIPAHSASSTLWKVYRLIMQATHCPPNKLGTHFTDLGPRIEG